MTTNTDELLGKIEGFGYYRHAAAMVDAKWERDDFMEKAHESLTAIRAALLAAEQRERELVGIASALAKLAAHAKDCLSSQPLPTGGGYWHCTCGLDSIVLDGELLGLTRTAAVSSGDDGEVKS